MAQPNPTRTTSPPRTTPDRSGWPTGSPAPTRTGCCTFTVSAGTTGTAPTGPRTTSAPRGAPSCDVLRVALAASLGDKELRADVRRCESGPGVNGVLTIAAALKEFAATADDLDADPWLLNCANGTLDLHTLQLVPHDPADRITKVCHAGYYENPPPPAPGTHSSTKCYPTNRSAITCDG